VTIKFYDVAIEATRDATQADFDMLVRYQIEKAADIYDLQQLLDRHGIPLPEGMKRRQPPPTGRSPL
jgi:hypothetical protein